MVNVGPRIFIKDGITYIYDESRGKILSIPRAYLSAGVKSRTVTNQFLKIAGDIPTMGVGNDILRNGTIVGLTANCEVSSTWILEIYKKGTSTPIATLSLSGQTKKEDTTIDVDVNKGDILQFKVNGTNIKLPTALLELAWRY